MHIFEPWMHQHWAILIPDAHAALPDAQLCAILMPDGQHWAMQMPDAHQWSVDTQQHWAMGHSTEPYWCLMQIIEANWAIIILLMHTELSHYDYWYMMQRFWAMMHSIEPCWSCLIERALNALLSQHWAILMHFAHHWAILILVSIITFELGAHNAIWTVRWAIWRRWWTTEAENFVISRGKKASWR